VGPGRARDRAKIPAGIRNPSKTAVSEQRKLAKVQLRGGQLCNTPGHVISLTKGLFQLKNIHRGFRQQPEWVPTRPDLGKLGKKVSFKWSLPYLVNAGIVGVLTTRCSAHSYGYLDGVYGIVNLDQRVMGIRNWRRRIPKWGI
jgi:hypothetical protein